MLKALASFAGVNRLAIGTFTLVFFLAFSLGAVSGGEAAVNESVSIHEVQQNLTVAEETVRENMTQKFSKEERILFHGVGLPAMYSTFDLAEFGVSYGYQHPWQAEWIGKLSGPVAVIYTAWLLIPPMKNGLGRLFG